MWSFDNFYEFDSWAWRTLWSPEEPVGDLRFCFKVADRHYEVLYTSWPQMDIVAHRSKRSVIYCLCRWCCGIPSRRALWF